ncbi:unnamed protein product [Callosobruchus maculatus]|uniref:Uncharacterized protein n=1 Tax=Callosobruchus maculatus TaxID=64391 RepID=A0A653CYC2_CALMS|nr:unnamed protein product [Callosobruchus maculatus]
MTSKISFLDSFKCAIGTFIYFRRNGCKGIRMFSERMVIKSSLTFESSITVNTCAELMLMISCFLMFQHMFDKLILKDSLICAMCTFMYFS